MLHEKLWPFYDMRRMDKWSNHSTTAVIKCMYLLPTYLHFIQDIEDMCLLLMCSTSFVNLLFQEHQMTKKHHMDQNPYISSLCPKLEIVLVNMTRGDDVAKSPGPINPRGSRPAKV
jgi:hypothetical protein